MAKQRHLSRAPIREAVIDIQFQSAVDSASVSEFATAFSNGKGPVSDLWATSLELRVGPAPGALQPEHTATLIGKRLDLDDGKHVVQFRMNGFTYSQLPPYDTWEAMSAGALEIWREYQAIVKPEEISRIALRYINALAIPLPVQNFDDYLTHAPQVPKELPQSLASFLNRVLIHDQENKDIAQVTQMLEGEASDGKAINILFDIDVFHPCQLKSATEEQIFSVLQRLREFKNKAFFGFLEEKILEPYA